MGMIVMCQLVAGVPVSLAAVPDPVQNVGMEGMDMSHCPDHATHQDHSGKHGCCTDAGCQCATATGLVAALPPVSYLVLAPRGVPESDIHTATLRIDLFLRPPIA
jgi:hypothetical protein